MATYDTLGGDSLFIISSRLRLRLHVMIYYPDAGSSLFAMLGQSTD